MKDYTKYDFAAIVGAEVKIRNEKGLLYNGKLLGGEKNKLHLANFDILAVRTREFGLIHFVSPSEIVSLSAKITPRRMNLEQLKKFAEDEAKQENADEWSLTIDKKGLSFDFASEGHKGIGVYINVDQPLSCTEWGWKE